MATCYITTCDVGDFLRITISPTTSPTTAQVEKLIKRAEDRIDRRTGHAWRTITTTEIFSLPLLYTFGWGTFISLKHRNIKYKSGADTCFDSSAGDKLEIWNGSNGTWTDYTLTPGAYDIEYIKGEVYLRGFIFSILRQNRVRVTYRYGDAIIPNDIKDAVVKLTVIDLIRSSIKMDDLEFGGSINKEQAMIQWEEDVDKIIRDREEVFILP
jgi:hypothetical protein